MENPFKSSKPLTDTKSSPPSGSELAADRCATVADTIRSRGKTHGDAFENLADVGKRWTSRLRAKGYEGPELTIADVCYFMNEVKLSRSAYGDASEVDHFVDLIGYSAIGAAAIDSNRVMPNTASPVAGDKSVQVEHVRKLCLILVRNHERVKVVQERGITISSDVMVVPFGHALHGRGFTSIIVFDQPTQDWERAYIENTVNTRLIPSGEAYNWSL